MTINGKEYKAPELTYLAIRKLSRMGVEISQLQGDPFAMLDGYTALAMGTDDIYKAQEELSAHFDNGGDLQELTAIVNAAVEESGFFRNINKAAEKVKAEQTAEA